MMTPRELTGRESSVYAPSMSPGEAAERFLVRAFGGTAILHQKWTMDCFTNAAGAPIWRLRVELPDGSEWSRTMLSPSKGCFQLAEPDFDPGAIEPGPGLPQGAPAVVVAMPADSGREAKPQRVVAIIKDELLERKIKRKVARDTPRVPAPVVTVPIADSDAVPAAGMRVDIGHHAVPRDLRQRLTAAIAEGRGADARDLALSIATELALAGVSASPETVIAAARESAATIKAAERTIEADAVRTTHRREGRPDPIEQAREAETAGYDLGDGAGERPTVDCSAGNRATVVDAAMAIFARHPAVYARGAHLVRVVRADKLDRDERLRTDAERLLIAPCAAEWIATELARRADFARIDRRARAPLACDPPAWLAPAMLADGEFRGIRPLRGIASTPVLRADGTVWATPGYDPQTGMLLAARGALPAIPAAPTVEHARAALEVLRALLAGYRWADEFSESVALSLILTKVARHLMPTAPLHLLTSPTAGSGKTQITEAASLIADGVHPSLSSWPGDDDEMRKVISAALLAGESFICFDNIANGRTLRSAALDRTLTAPVVADRRLGTSETMTLVNGATWCATGNNVTPCADMVRRVIVSRIDPCTERPWERPFAWTPAQYAREHRAELLAAALIVLAAHLRANPGPLAPPMQSFGDWSRIVRDALLWLGLPDAVRSQDAIADEDPDAEDRAELLAALREQYGAARFGAEDLARTVRDAGMGPATSTAGRLATAIRARINDRPATAVRVGHVLRTVKDQVSGGYALRGRMDRHSKVTVWRIETLAPPADRAGDSGDAGGRFRAPTPNCQTGMTPDRTGMTPDSSGHKRGHGPPQFPSSPAEAAGACATEPIPAAADRAETPL